MTEISDDERLKILLNYLEEDAGRGDITTESLGLNTRCKAEITAKSRAILAGISAIIPLLEHFDIRYNKTRNDGDPCANGDMIIELEGAGADILKVERLILNIISRMSGIASATRLIVERALKENPNIIVAATRKTTPGFRLLEKEAVVIGGGHPHRFDLAEAVMIKDNHLKFFKDAKAALEKTTTYLDGMDDKTPTSLEWGTASPVRAQRWVEIEADTYETAEAAVTSGADIVMLDNMTPEQSEQSYKKLKALNPDVLIEISGGITSDNISDYAKNADIISLGWLTHSAPAVDFSLNISEIY